MDSICLSQVVWRCILCSCAIVLVIVTANILKTKLILMLYVYFAVKHIWDPSTESVSQASLTEVPHGTFFQHDTPYRLVTFPSKSLQFMQW